MAPVAGCYHGRCCFTIETFVAIFYGFQGQGSHLETVAISQEQAGTREMAERLDDTLFTVGFHDNAPER